MYRKWMLILILAIPLLTLACLGQTAVTEVVPTITDTSTPVVNLNSVAAQTQTVASEIGELSKPTATPAPTQLPETATLTIAPAEEVAIKDEVLPASTSNNLAASVVYERFFAVQTGTPVGLPNWAHAEAGCNWMGIAGQIFDLTGTPAINFVVEAGGTLEGNPVLGLSLTGLNSVYGPGGFEVYLANHITASQNTVWIEIKDTQGKLVSERIYLSTYNDCNQNLILLNFVETAELPNPPTPYPFYLPLIYKSSP